MAEPAAASGSADAPAPGKPDMTGWHDVDITDWHWFAEKDKLHEFELPKELKANVKTSQKRKKRETRQRHNATNKPN